MEITDQSFNIVDIKPANMEELQEVKYWTENPYDSEWWMNEWMNESFILFSQKLL